MSLDRSCAPLSFGLSGQMCLLRSASSSSPRAKAAAGRWLWLGVGWGWKWVTLCSSKQETVGPVHLSLTAVEKTLDPGLETKQAPCLASYLLREPGGLLSPPAPAFSLCKGEKWCQLHKGVGRNKLSPKLNTPYGTGAR